MKQPINVLGRLSSSIGSHISNMILIAFDAKGANNIELKWLDIFPG